MEKRIFHLPQDDIPEIMAYLFQTTGKKLTEEEMRRGEMVLEETFLRLQAGMNNPQMTADVTVRKRFGDISLIITAQGEAVNPIMSLTEWVEDEADLYNVNVLKANRDRLGYSRRNGANVVSIKVHEGGVNLLYMIFSSTVLGMVCGFLLKTAFSPETVLLVDRYLREPVTVFFMNALDMMIEPVVFFSIIAGITNLAETADIGKMGGRLIGQSLVLMMLTSVLSVATALLLFPHELSYMVPLFENSGGDFLGEAFSLSNIFMGIMPNNLVDPFKDGKLVQILFLAIFFGVVLNRLGEKANIAREIIEFMNSFCMSVMGIIIQSRPWLIFITMMGVAVHIEIGIFVNLGKIILGSFLGLILVWGLWAVILAFYGRIKPLAFLKKIVSFAPIPMAICSSTGSLPDTLDLATKKLGISPRLASFAIPVGIQLHQTGTCFCLALPTIMMAQVLGLPINREFILYLVLYVFIISYIIPTVPGGGLMAMGTVFAAVGIPPSAVMFFLCVDFLTDMLNTVNNVSGNVADVLLLARKNNMLDEEKYLKV
ncbi:dicarboxylate/amino acid:cation symporter [Selenomonas sp. KH1T6]|uniref:dicarboxylate/amino acid:cation symporter n=1 Tax=Selenomonas sp. KH1T6 TaxID=3158784 RepID=UPI0008A74795|nr:Na+/H+-dicarboxylate symporter [Selenomonas ruminantium]